jgi:hypothetical protein
MPEHLAEITRKRKFIRIISSPQDAVSAACGNDAQFSLVRFRLQADLWNEGGYEKG